MAFCVVVCTLAAACSDDSGEPYPPAAQEEASADPLAQRNWLDAADPAMPHVWLVSRMNKADADPDDPALDQVAAMLEAASQHFLETRRMIANRAVQLEEMLAEIDLAEPAPALIEALLHVVDAEPRAESFGSLCQHYYNLRSAGLGRDEALADLKRRHGER